MGVLIAAVSATPAAARVIESPAGATSPRRPHAVDEDAEHEIAQAATWHIDPSVLRPHLTDSLETAAARAELGVISGRLAERVTAYDDARSAAATAEADALEAQTDLDTARTELRAARERYDAARYALVDALTQRYTATQLAPLVLVLTSEDADQLEDLTRLEEMARVQSGLVEDAETARERLQAAEIALEDAEQHAAAVLDAANDALADADRARQEVLAEAQSARSALEASALADVVARETVADGYRGAITFPLAPGTPYTDLDNFGARSKHWATVHTGDDFSAACGSPVVAATDGTVMIRTDQSWSGPWLVMVSTEEGSLTTWYAHLQSLDVADGDRVHAGDPIGKVGQQGNATGCHLHFEVHPTGGTIYQDDTDPAVWLRTVGAYPPA